MARFLISSLVFLSMFVSQESKAQAGGYYSFNFANPDIMNNAFLYPTNIDPAQRRVGQIILNGPPGTWAFYGSGIIECIPWLRIADNSVEPIPTCYGIENQQGATGILLGSADSNNNNPSYGIYSAKIKLLVPSPYSYVRYKDYVSSVPTETANTSDSRFYQISIKNPKVTNSTSPCTVTTYPDARPYGFMSGTDYVITIPLNSSMYNEYQIDIQCPSSFKGLEEHYNGSFGGKALIKEFIFTTSPETPMPTPTPTPSTDISIASVRVGQVLWDPKPLDNGRISLIAGKSAFFEVVVKNSNSLATGNTRVIAQVGNEVWHSGVIALNTIPSSGLIIPLSEMKYIPSVPGSFQASFSLESDILDSNTANNTKQVDFDVYQSQNLKIGLTRIQGCDAQTFCYSFPAENYIASYLNSSPRDAYLTDILPVPNRGIVLEEITSTPFKGSSNKATIDSDPDFAMDAGIAEDFGKLSQKKRSLQLSRLVGVVSQDYFSKYHIPEKRASATIKGLAYQNYPGAAIIVEGSTSALPHELIHTLGQNREAYEVLASPTGYYVQNTSLLTGGVSERLETYIPPRVSVMGAASFDPDSYWIDPESYSIAFRKLTGPRIDPELLLITGILDKRGSFKPIDTSIISEGFLSEDENGPVKIELTDVNNRSLYKTSVAPSFKVSVLYHVPEVDTLGLKATDFKQEVNTGYQPVSLALPYSKDLQTISITQNGKVIYKENPKSKALEDAIKTIPDLAFLSCSHLAYLASNKQMQSLIKSCGKVSRDLLILDVKLYKELSLKKFTQVSQKRILLNLRFLISKGVKDYSVSDALDRSKDEIIDIIDRLLSEL